jgi:hypothetical protein
MSLFLGKPYREALPKQTSVAFASHDYDPTKDPMNQGQQIKLHSSCRYSILNKEPTGWWRVHNSDGLIGYVPCRFLVEMVE